MVRDHLKPDRAEPADLQQLFGVVLDLCLDFWEGCVRTLGEEIHVKIEASFAVVSADLAAHRFSCQLLGMLVAVPGTVVDGHGQVGKGLAKHGLFLTLEGLGFFAENLVAVDSADGVPLDGLPPGVDETSCAASFPDQASCSNRQNALGQTT